MRTLWLALWLLVPAGLLIGQIDSDTITITSARTVYSQPDQAVLNVSISSMTPISLDEAVVALQGTGLTASNLTGSSGLSWVFSMPVALSKLQATLASLTALQQTLSKQTPVLNLTFSVSGTQLSTDLQSAQPCGTADLLADATAQAQKLADVAGVTLGPVVSLATAPTPANIILAQRQGDFSIGVGLAAFISPTPPNPVVNCSLTVQFRLVRSR